MTVRDWFELIKIYAVREEGQTMAEYGVILTILSVGVIASLGALVAALTGNLKVVTTALGGVIA